MATSPARSASHGILAEDKREQRVSNHQDDASGGSCSGPVEPLELVLYLRGQ